MSSIFVKQFLTQPFHFQGWLDKKWDCDLYWLQEVLQYWSTNFLAAYCWLLVRYSVQSLLRLIQSFLGQTPNWLFRTALKLNLLSCFCLHIFIWDMYIQIYKYVHIYLFLTNIGCNPQARYVCGSHLKEHFCDCTNQDRNDFAVLEQPIRYDKYVSKSCL